MGDLKPKKDVPILNGYNKYLKMCDIVSGYEMLLGDGEIRIFKSLPSAMKSFISDNEESFTSVNPKLYNEGYREMYIKYQIDAAIYQDKNVLNYIDTIIKNYNENEQHYPFGDPCFMGEDEMDEASADFYTMVLDLYASVQGIFNSIVKNPKHRLLEEGNREAIKTAINEGDAHPIDLEDFDRDNKAAHKAYDDLHPDDSISHIINTIRFAFDMYGEAILENGDEDPIEIYLTPDYFEIFACTFNVNPRRISHYNIKKINVESATVYTCVFNGVRINIKYDESTKGEKSIRIVGV